MDRLSRAFHRAQLWGVLAFDRETFLDIYRRAVGLRPVDAVPLNISYTQMAETILDREQREQSSAKRIRPIGV